MMLYVGRNLNDHLLFSSFFSHEKYPTQVKWTKGQENKLFVFKCTYSGANWLCAGGFLWSKMVVKVLKGVFVLKWKENQFTLETKIDYMSKHNEWCM